MSALTNPAITHLAEALALELRCPICLQLFSEPVSLPCGHIYCHVCIQTLGEGLDHHCCPECQKDYQESQVVMTCSKMCNIVESFKAAVGEVQLPACVAVEDETKCHLDVTKESSGSEGKYLKSKEFQLTNSGLASQVTDLAVHLEMSEDVLRKEKEQQAKLMAAHEQLREKASEELRQLSDVVKKYSAEVMQLLDEELSPSEASASHRVGQAASLTKQLRQVLLRAESLLTKGDEAAFVEDFRDLRPRIAEMTTKNIEKTQGRMDGPVRILPKLENMNGKLRESLGIIQRSLRNVLNPSELTFDIRTAHPNLVLSEDLKTVTFSATKQPYPPSSQRFTSFFQVLSSQSFSEGNHRWEVELDGAPWIVGLCQSRELERSGIPSALESSRCSWCLMWFDNLLTAFEQGRDVPLKRTTVSCRLEIRLSFRCRTFSFYHISPTVGKTLMYTFKANFTEPVHLAYRMMSGHPKARVTIIS
ncbi:E3 ubiquitin/ISG15 ligase TRIM25-like isoform X1 [Hippocampus zosterae]|uniref:E3 ubiquitin/ISG15 ligase TRIM25-like isoform X1 n=1 Tax=Hippocampus zosterae TaxID=109293 RepID=UPI00223D7405|nr:E3 ubiquitin/ISG15 ligase TRIM25-like isoform X1 [Hippocampus zosterae]XP_051931943.1 E3 ubiquitin/ISG15 ligase TRIM25-like isoform X1 [Hippocampus zosterae]